jgi:hypothetical protein
MDPISVARSSVLWRHMIANYLTADTKERVPVDWLSFSAALSAASARLPRAMARPVKRNAPPGGSQAGQSFGLK